VTIYEAPPTFNAKCCNRWRPDGHLADEGIENVNTASNGKGCAIVCCSNTYYNVKGKQQLSFSGFHTIYKGINSFAYYDLWLRYSLRHNVFGLNDIECEKGISERYIK
jgi:hypothetical protein